MTEWGYARSRCPMKNWEKLFPIATGETQSPIDIQTGKVKYNKALEPLVMSYRPETAENIVATGHSVQVNFTSGSTLKGAHLEGTYSLAQFHLHWGQEKGKGSEHTIDGSPTEAELHFVHWNSTKYENIGEALGHPDGLAVVGALIREDDEKSTGQAKHLIDQFEENWTIGEKYPIKGEMNFEALYPSRDNFYTYCGSLTTPPLNQCVKWTVLTAPLYFSTAEMEKLRSLPNQDGGCLSDNFRTPQPINERTVETNFNLI